MKKLLLMLSLFYTAANSQIISSKDIDPSLKAIALASYLSLDRAKNLTEKFSIYDTYIKATTTTKRKYFVVFCVNIQKSTLYKELKKIQQILPSAYIASDSRVKQLSKENQSVEHKNIEIAYTEDINNTIIVDNNILENNQTIKDINTSKFIIDPKKDSITIKYTNSKKEALELAKDLKEYDIYLKRILFKENNVYMVYVVNITPLKYKKIFKKIHSKYSDSHKTSQRRVSYFMNNIVDEDIFIKATKKKRSYKRKNIKKKKAYNTVAILDNKIKNDNKEFNIAYNYFKKQQYKKALKILKKLLIDYPSNIKINFYLGRSYYELKNYEQASAAFDRITIIDENNLRALLELSQTYLMLGLNEDAINGFNKVLTYKLPTNVRKNIENRVKYIENLKNTSYILTSAIIGITYDNNINSTTDVKDFIIPNYGVSSITDKKYSDAYISYMLNGTYGLDLNNNTNIENKISIVVQNYFKDKDRKNDLSSIDIAKEVKKKLELASYSFVYNKFNNKNNISTGLDITSITLANEKYMDIYGLSIMLQKRYFTLSRYYLINKILINRYNDTKNKKLNSSVFQIITGQSIYSKKYGLFNFSFDYQFEDRYKFSPDAPNRYKNSIILSNSYDINKKISIDTSYLYTKTRELSKDATFNIKKTEYYNNLSIGTTINLSNSLALSSSIKTIHNGSNIKIFSYNKINIDCFIKKSF